MNQTSNQDLKRRLNNSYANSSQQNSNNGLMIVQKNNYNDMQDTITQNQHQSNREHQGSTVHQQDGLQKSARKNFIKKVYSIVGLQLLFTVLMSVMSTYWTAFMNFQVENMFLFYVAIGLIVVTQITIFCCKAGRQHPYNLIALGLFTFGQAYVVSFISALVANADGGGVVVMAGCMTLMLVASLTLYAIFSKSDFTTSMAILIVFLTSLIMFFMFMFISWTPFGQTLYCSLGIFVFGLYLVIDTQMIMGGKRFALSMDDYVVAALLLYIDIIQLFLFILSLLSKK